MIYLPDGTYNPAKYSGPGTNVKVRISRNDQPLAFVDKVAEGHDLRYALASVDNDVRVADNKMVQLLQKGQAQKLDSNFNINQAMLIKAKILLEDRLGVPKTFFTTYGKQNQSPAENAMYQNKLNELQQQGFGMSHTGINIKHLKHLKRKEKILLIYMLLYILNINELYRITKRISFYNIYKRFSNG